MAEKLEQPLNTHIVEVVACPVEQLAQEIEAAYTRLNARAECDGSVILTVTQAVNTYHTLDVKTNVYVQHGLVTITAQRISREQLESQQRQTALMMGNRQGPRGTN